MGVEFDHAIEVGSARHDQRRDDRLARQSVAKLLANRLIAYPGRVGVYGSWGSGKSFVLDLTIDELFNRQSQKQYRPIVCYFQPWQAEPDTSLVPGLIKAIENVPAQFPGLNPRFEYGSVDQIHQTAGILLRAIRQAVGILGPVAHFAAAALSQVPAGTHPVVDGIKITATGVDKVLEAVPTAGKTEQTADWDPEDPDDIKNRMCQLVEELRKSAAQGEGGNPGDYRVVVVIDDLDRCAPDLMVDLLNWLKVHLSVPDCSYLLALDHEAASKAIVGKYRAYIGERADYAYGLRYLEKIVDYEVELGDSQFVEQMAAQAVSGTDSVIAIVERLINRQGVRLAETRKLLTLTTLQSPRTMLKVVERFGAVLRAVQDDQDRRDRAHAEVRQLPADYSFWLLLLVAMYYRLSRGDIEAFCQGQGPLVSPEWKPPDKSDPSLYPLTEFRWFLDTTMRGGHGESTQPTPAVLLQLYTSVRQLVVPVGDASAAPPKESDVVAIA